MQSRPWAVLLVVAFCGCQLTPAPPLTPCPLPIAEQTAKILEIAPLGTPRDEAIERLEKAGIVGNFSTGSSKSTFYCDVWPQPDKERWHINVVLLFDEDGALYGTLPALPSAVKKDTPSTSAADELVPLQ
ncbi:MAG TPA: hypothetical protein VFG20_21345 [Planctomycetaceae bacterium]|nr:hypothetical protein [Planctomycetaceae bacterium]